MSKVLNERDKAHDGSAFLYVFEPMTSRRLEDFGVVTICVAT